MNNSTQILLYILLLIVTMASGYWFYNNFAWVKEEKETGFEGIAKTNTLLAAEFFLRKMGVPTRQVNSLVAFRDLPSAKHSILITTQRETINKELSEELLKWVKSGGHLIVEARYGLKDTKNKDWNDVTSEKDHLLEPFSVFAIASNADEDNADIPVIVDLERALQRNNIQINFPYQRILSRSKSPDSKNSELQNSSKKVPQPVWTVSDELGKYVLQFALEKGLLTVLATTSIFKNEDIADFDHARFLHYLVQEQGNREGVWLIRIDDMPPLWQWLWNNAWHAMLCLTLVFLFWLWRAPLRFGPQLNDAQTERRSLLEHIRASGYYRWNEKQSDYLLCRVQESLWEKIHVLHPVVRRENLFQAYALLEDITGIDQSLIKQALSKRALTKEKPINEREFTRQIKMLKLIRKHL